MTIVAGNKLKNGAIKFSEFAGEMRQQFGDGVRAYTKEMEQVYRQTMDKLGFGDKIDEADIKRVKIGEMQAGREAKAAQQRLADGIRDAENRPAYKLLSDAERAWLESNPRHKELAFDPDNKRFKVREAQAALKAEQTGVLNRPSSVRLIHRAEVVEQTSLMVTARRGMLRKLLTSVKSQKRQTTARRCWSMQGI